MFSLTQFDSFLFAFDGVIVDSVDLNVSAFGELYAGHGEDIRGMVEAYQRAHPGEPRHEKIPMFHRTLLGQELTRSEIKAECDRLGGIIRDDILDCPLMPDIAEAFHVLEARGIARHIVSSVPHDELRMIAASRGLAQHFNSVHGGPLSKEMICEAIFATSRVNRARYLFVGTTMADYRCAANIGVAFLGIGEVATAPFPFGTQVVERLGEAFLEIATAHLGQAFIAPPPFELGPRFKAA